MLARSPADHHSYPSAELSPDTVVDATNAILDRLDSADRVRLVLPYPINEGAGEWLAPAWVRQNVLTVPPLPAKATSLVFPPRTPADSGAEIWLAPGGTVTPADETITLVELAPDLPPVTIERLSATPTEEGWRVDVIFRNHTAETRYAPYVTLSMNRDEVVSFAPSALGVMAGQPPGVEIPADGLASVSFTVAKPFVAVALLGEFAEVESVAYLICDAGEPVRAFVDGDDMIMVHRYIKADPAVVRTTNDESAELLIARANRVPAGFGMVPQMTFDDHSGELAYENVTLAEAEINSTHPAMANVDLSGVAVKELKVFHLIYAGSEVLASYDGKPIIMDVSHTDRAPWIVVSFDISPENTNWTLDESFVVFMANSVRYLVPRNHAQVGYVAPLEAAGWEQWTPLSRMLRTYGGLHLWPAEGFWADEWGRAHAVSLVGLDASEPATLAMDIIDRWALPAPSLQAEVLALWPALTLLAAGLWGLGWALR
jgi:hypothetical protein